MKFIKCILMVAAQFVGMAILAYLLFNTIWISRVLYAVCSWVVWPVAGLISAYLVTVRGVNNFVGWIAPPAAGLLAHYLAFFYMPDSAGPFFVCALASIIGAAAGDVTKKFKRN